MGDAFDFDSEMSDAHEKGVSTCPTLAAACCCNTNVIFVGDGKGILHYVTSYITKYPVELTMVTNLFSAAIQEVARRPSIAEDSGTNERTTQHVITRLINKLHYTTKTPAAIAALCLLNYPSTISSHEHWFFYGWLAMRMLVGEGQENDERDNYIPDDEEQMQEQEEDIVVLFGGRATRLFVER